jgi:hypothetical protein
MRVEKMQELRDLGWTLRAIAAEVGVCHQTVAKRTVPAAPVLTDYQLRAVRFTKECGGLMTVSRWSLECGSSRFACRCMLRRLEARGYLEVFAWHELTAKQQHAIRLESGPKAVMCVVWGITRKGVKAARDLTRQGVAA